MCNKDNSRGLTLIELIVFIVIISVALTGVLTVLNHTVRNSADPMLRKQALAIAEALLEEVMLQPFTWCDPDDSAALTASSHGGCSTPENNLAPDAGESRTVGATQVFDNVNDYHGLTTTTNIAGGGSAKYTASVTVQGSALGPAGTLVGDGTNSSAALLITVSVTSGSETIEIQGYRTRYAPNSVP